LVAVAIFACAPAALVAQTVSLSAEQVEAAKEAGARANAQAADAVDTAPPRKRAVHGEVGIAIGTGGYGAIYGTVIAPIGDDGFVALSIANERFGNVRRRPVR